MREAVIAKIKKLLAASNGRSQEEFEKFQAKAMELMAEWNVQQDELADSRTVHEVGKSFITVKYINPWRRAIIDQLSHHCRVFIVYTTRTTRVDVYGMAEARELFAEMFFSLEKQVVDVCRAMFPKDHTNARRAESGLGHAVAVKIWESRQYAGGTGDGKALIPADIAAAKEFATAEFGGAEIPMRKYRKIKDSRSFRIGANAVDAVQLHGEVKK